MTARQQRRREERKFRKRANKASEKVAATALTEPAVDEPLQQSPEPIGFEPQGPSRAEIDRAAVNKQNAQHSTGPKTSEGKAISSMNNFRHGLAGNFAVLDWEDSDRYGELLFQLHREHQPETMTECVLVERMAQHQWLSQRALHLQNFCFNMDVPHCEQEKQLALYLRYGTTHDRAFHKCLADLLKFRAHKAKEQNGFESQERQEAAKVRKQELHETKLRTLHAKKAPLRPPTPEPAMPVIALNPVPDGFVPQSDPLNMENYKSCYVGM